MSRYQFLTVGQYKLRYLANECQNQYRKKKRKFSGIHGGRKHRERSTGQRKSSTFKKDCPCLISFRLDEEGDNLLVSRLDTEHNHDINKSLYGFDPKVRKLSAADKSYAEQLLAIKADKKMLQQQLKKDTGIRL